MIFKKRTRMETARTQATEARERRGGIRIQNSTPDGLREDTNRPLWDKKLYRETEAALNIKGLPASEIPRDKLIVLLRVITRREEIRSGQKNLAEVIREETEKMETR